MRILLFLPLLLVLLTPATSWAQASAAACQDLARAYAENPKKLNDNTLASLRTCISNELASRVMPVGNPHVPPLKQYKPVGGSSAAPLKTISPGQ